MRRIGNILILLLLTACGGGETTPGGLQVAGPGPGTSSVRLRVDFGPTARGQIVAQGSAGAITRASIDILDAQSGVPVTGTTEVLRQGDESSRAVTITGVTPGLRRIEARFFDSLDQQVAFDDETVTLGSTLNTQVTLSPEGAPSPSPSPMPPVANDDHYSTLSGVELVVPAAQGVLANDISQNGTASLVSGPALGSVTLNPDGSFTYQPPAGPSAVDTFAYRLDDASGSDQATVTIDLTARALFVQAGATGAGTLDDPRGDLDGALMDAGPGDTVFVLFSGTPLMTAGPSTVPAGVALIGEASGLMSGMTVIVPPGNRPEINGQLVFEDDTKAAGFLSTAPNGTINLELANADSVVLDNLHVSNSSTKIGMVETSGTVSITNSEFFGGGQILSDLSAGSIDLLFENNQFNTTPLVLNVDGAGTAGELTFTDNTLGGLLRPNSNDGATFDILVQANSFGSGADLDFEQFNGGQGDILVLDNTFVQSNQLRLEANGVGGGGRVEIINNLMDQMANVAINLQLNGGTHALVITNNLVTAPPARFQEFIIQSRTGNTTIARVEDNEFELGAIVEIGSGGNLSIAILNNEIGNSPGPGGPLRRELRVLASAAMAGDVLCTRIAGNTMGTVPIGGGLVVHNFGAATLNVESLLTLMTENTAAGFSVLGTVTDVPLGTCTFP